MGLYDDPDYLPGEVVRERASEVLGREFEGFWTTPSRRLSGYTPEQACQYGLGDAVLRHVELLGGTPVAEVYGRPARELLAPMEGPVIL